MDLSLYPTAAEEKLFLQDLYMALAAKGDIVVFEHYEDVYKRQPVRNLKHFFF